ncbi:putative serine/threonine-protein kinase PIX13 [Apium graveolens]|uniref:putative serine/threonine-protein kinase PIX13 n=1 Tax=Apium graveolens TaxID=4045 RepID=UPI003D79007E
MAPILLADDIFFSTLKASAAKGYLAPEYTTIGRFIDKNDVYAYGMIILQILSGKHIISQSIRQGAELGRLEDFMDVNLEGKYVELEVIKMGKLALLCTHESPNQRPDIEIVL